MSTRALTTTRHMIIIIMHDDSQQTQASRRMLGCCRQDMLGMKEDSVEALLFTRRWA